MFSSRSSTNKSAHGHDEEYYPKRMRGHFMTAVQGGDKGRGLRHFFALASYGPKYKAIARDIAITLLAGENGEDFLLTAEEPVLLFVAELYDALTSQFQKNRIREKINFAADQKNPGAMCARALVNGLSPREIKAALIEASEQGSAEASFRLYCYHSKETDHYLSKAAEQGDDYAEFLMQIGSSGIPGLIKRLVNNEDNCVKEVLPIVKKAAKSGSIRPTEVVIDYYRARGESEAHDHWDRLLIVNEARIEWPWIQAPTPPSPEEHSISIPTSPQSDNCLPSSPLSQITNHYEENDNRNPSNPSSPGFKSSGGPSIESNTALRF